MRALLLPLLCSAALSSACAAPRPAAPGSHLGPHATPPSRAASQRVLRIGTSGDYAPFSKDGEGFDIALAERMAADLGYRIEWVTFRWPELAERVARNEFDIAMSGVTFRAQRAVVGFMSRAVASGGPCVLGEQAPKRVAVNRGGILERWARERFAGAELRAIDNNLALPALLSQGAVDAIVTDSFELPHFARQVDASAHCEPPRDRKVYWVSPRASQWLAAPLERWLEDNEPRLRELRARFLGRATEWTPRQHLVDLLARRLSLMPAVAAYKREHGLPIEDPQREAVVLEQTLQAARQAGLDQDSVRDLFVEQIALAKAVQQRAGGEAAAMDLESQLRPALSGLGTRIVAALRACAGDLHDLRLEDLDLLSAHLQAQELARMLAALRKVRAQPRAAAARHAPAARAAWRRGRPCRQPATRTQVRSLSRYFSPA